MNVRKARRSELPAIARTLAGAFFDDPVMGVIFHDASTRHERLVRFFGAVIDVVHFRHDQVFVTEDASAAAVWNPPDRWRVDLAAQLRLAPRLLGVFRERAFVAMRMLDAIQTHHLHEPHSYLAILGVDPSKQGRGLGAKVLAPVLEECDAHGRVAYLESSNEKNVPFYRRHGFAITRELPLPEGARVFLMRRDARAAQA